MTTDELVAFIESKMSMSHVYQPLLIRALVDAGGAMTLRQLAQRFAAEDENQIAFYEKRIKEMPLKVLKKHGVVSATGPFLSLSTDELSLEDKARVRLACEQQLQAFIAKRGMSIWEYRMIEDAVVPDNLRYRVLKDANYRCALCGITNRETPIDVDHIIPRARWLQRVRKPASALREVRSNEARSGRYRFSRTAERARFVVRVLRRRVSGIDCSRQRDDVRRPRSIAGHTGPSHNRLEEARR